MAAVSVAAVGSAEPNRLNVGSAVTTYYDDRAEGLTCLLIHGTGGTMDRHYRSLIPLLARGYRVVGLDLGMPAADERLELHHLVDQVEAVVEAAKLRGTGLTVIGYSLGAVVAAAYAARRPAEPARLVLINGWAKADAHQLLRNGIWQGLYDSAIEQLPRLTVFTSYSARFLNTRTPEEIDLLIAGTTVDEARKRQMELNVTADITSLLGSITCPTLILAGEYDITVPLTQGYALLEGIADARLVSIPSGHAALAERPERVFDLIDRFIREGEDHPAHRG